MIDPRDTHDTHDADVRAHAIHTSDGRTWAGSYALGGLIPQRGVTRKGTYAYVVRRDGSVLYASTRATQRIATHARVALSWPSRTLQYASPVRTRIDRSVITRTAQENNARAHVGCM